MKSSSVIIRLYRLALICFPPAYRDEYADELFFAFRMAGDDAASKGRLALACFSWRELCGLPWALVQAHIRERERGMDSHPTASVPGGPIRGWRLGAVFLPFFMPLFLILPVIFRSGRQHIVPNTIALVLLAALAAIWFTAFARGFPTWTLPASGLVLYFFTAILGVAALGILHYFVLNPFAAHGLKGPAIDLPVKVISTICSGLFLCFLLAGFLRLAPNLRSRVQHDWTLLSFLLFGAAIPTVIRFDGFTGLQWHQTASLTALGCGAAIYLLARRRWLRISALFATVVISQGLMSLGIFQAYPSQVWAGTSDLAARTWAAIEPLSNPLPILLLLPAWILKLAGPAKAAPAPAPALPPATDGV